ncbi:MAG: UDP-N-acetylmuramate--L-alanine ligase [Firmicutes bacterium]|nr:UDP-N-acetylmuramate--L-alanine ligase [Bacillota bacterium]MDD4263107.1 UDP-N-acetylmuramate--L-alanine ligase [Bacillota bacterium]MDD4693420.1 UDP-N-acetylmuramate--L-alanine ligase [Bacillota bacterium]
MWYHYIGIGGIGMSALAAIMLSRGHKVTGSDLKENLQTDQLQRQGARIFIGHFKENVGNPDVVVYSTAVLKDNPERVAAREKNIKEIHRSENLAEILDNHYGIAISGAHGKTTTSAMITYMLYKLGQDPTGIIGGYIPQLGGNYRVGKSDLVVAESDESDGSFLHYVPKIGSISSVDADHLENFQFDYEKLYDAYKKFVASIRDLALICADDKKTLDLAKYATSKVLTYGLNAGDLRAYDILEGETTTFKVRLKDQELGVFSIKLPGKHNVANCLVAIAVALELGLDIEEVKQALLTFSGIGRRFEIRYQTDDLLIVDDYGHHPTEIEATVDAARNRYPDKEIWLCFQPHRYSRTKLLWDDFPKALAHADKIVVLGIYAPPPEQPIPGVSGAVLAQEVKKLGKTVFYAETLEDAAELLKEKAPKGALILTMGAGTITKLPELVHIRLVQG